MTENFKPKPLNGPMYAVIYPFMAARAHECGYALALHGTLGRDLDLVAIPWTNEATSPEDLVARILDVMEGSAFTMERADGHAEDKSEKPHGRRCFVLHLKSWTGAYVDLSVMPRTRATPPSIPMTTDPLQEPSGGARLKDDRPPATPIPSDGVPCSYGNEMGGCWAFTFSIALVVLGLCFGFLCMWRLTRGASQQPRSASISDLCVDQLHGPVEIGLPGPSYSATQDGLQATISSMPIMSVASCAPRGVGMPRGSGAGLKKGLGPSGARGVDGAPVISGL